MSLRHPAALAAAVLATALTAGTAPALADTPTPLTPHSTFTFQVDETNGKVTVPASGEDIPNVDSVKSTIRTYYKATGGLADRTSSPYISEVTGIEQSILDKLPTTAPAGAALVFDTDDTLLWNYDYEDKGSNFNYDPTSNAQWVTGKNADGTDFTCPNGTETGGFCFPAVPGMPELLKTLHEEGYPLFIVTGRPAAQQQATIDNLTAAGFTDTGTSSGTPLFTADKVFAKDVTSPWLDCAQDGSLASACSTVEWKAQTRKHIEAGTDGTLGTDDDLSILANVGDQLSDLWGGYTAEDAAVKLPNPTYFLSSPDLVAPGPHDQASTLVLRDSYTMAPDGSSGLTADGDAIPNIDPVRTEIRAFYAATNGISNKTTSPYITEVNSLEKSWTSEITTSCQTQLKAVGAANSAVADASTALAKATTTLTHAEKKAKAAKKKVKKAHGKKARKAARKKLKKATEAVSRASKAVTSAKAALAGITVPGKPAVVFDSDDTTLWNYDMEDGAMKFAFTTAQQNDWVQAEQMPSVPGMPQLVATIADAGCTVVGLTGRSNDQLYATLGNLTKDGYTDFTRKLFFTKWYDQTAATADRVASRPSYLSGCTLSPTCTTVEFKSLTRKHIESDLGYQIVANVGDQFSDLTGGYADKTYKLPNPTYYLP